jgi:hypothetical protein
MRPKEEIVFWKKARKLISKNYGGKCCAKKYMDFRCAGCLSGLVDSWIDMHLDLLQWDEKGKKK